MSQMIVRTFPSDDLEFRRLVMDTVRKLAEQDDDVPVAEVLVLVRARFPDADIHPQDGLARLGGEVVWYAYRDGYGAAKM